LLEQGLGQVQPGGRRGDRPRASCIDGLVAHLVQRIGRVLDVWRKRDLSGALQKLQHLDVELQLEKIARAPDHLGVRGVEVDALAATRRMAGPEQRERSAWLEHPLDERLHAPAARFGSEQASLDDARVVQQQQVPGLQQRRKLREMQVGDPVLGQVQQAAGRAIVQRALRDQLRRQFVIEVGKSQIALHGLTGHRIGGLVSDPRRTLPHSDSGDPPIAQGKGAIDSGSRRATGATAPAGPSAPPITRPTKAGARPSSASFEAGTHAA